MSIYESTVDVFSNEMYGLPCALNFYYYGKDIPNIGVNDNDYLTVCPSIQSVQYVPFLNVEDFNLHKSPYHYERFGDANGTVIDVSNCNVYRVIDVINHTKEIGSFKVYKPSKNIGGVKDYKNESRLYNYPFEFSVLTDHLNPPMEIKYHLIYSDIPKVKVKSTISDRCSYGIYIEGYKGDYSGKSESIVSGEAHELPCSSSAYNQWFAANKNQQAQQLNNVMQNTFLTKQTSSNMLIPSTIGSMAGTTLNPMSIIGSGANMLGNLMQHNATNKRANLDIQQTIKGQLAQTKDLNNTPNTMLSMGSDVYYGLFNGGKKVTLYRYTLHPSQLQKIGDYFAMFGYKQNKIMQPNIRNRYYFNYIKTTGVNITSSWIPRNHLEELKSIFDNGVTVWHIDREGVVVGDISKDNYEI